jgi:hypothetical protein
MANLSGLTKLAVDEIKIRRPHSTGPRENIFDIITSWLILNYDRIEADVTAWMQQHPDLFRGVPGLIGHTGAPGLGVESFLERLTSLEQQMQHVQSRLP